MSLERDTTRIVRSWLENGSTALPDRVLDAVLSELPSTPQRRLPWSPRRTTKMAIRFAALAAILLLALVGALVIGTSGGRSAPSPTAITGTITTLADDGSRPTTDVEATVTGSTVAGTVVFGSSSPTPLFTLGLECVRRVDADTWIFGGHVLSTTSNGPPVGHPTAFLYRQGAQPKAGGWFEDEPHAADCPAFVAGIDLDRIEGQNWMWDVVRGELAIPSGVGA